MPITPFSDSTDIPAGPIEARNPSACTELSNSQDLRPEGAIKARADEADNNKVQEPTLEQDGVSRDDEAELGPSEFTEGADTTGCADIPPVVVSRFDVRFVDMDKFSEHFKENDVQSATLMIKPMFNFLGGEVAAGRITQEEMNQRLASWVKKLPLSEVKAVDDASTDLRAVENEELQFFVESVFNEIMEEMKNLFVDGKDEKIKYQLKQIHEVGRYFSEGVLATLLEMDDTHSKDMLTKALEQQQAVAVKSAEADAARAQLNEAMAWIGNMPSNVRALLAGSSEAGSSA